VLFVLVVGFPLANLPGIKLLAKIASVGVICFVVMLTFAYVSAGDAGLPVNH